MLVSCHKSHKRVLAQRTNSVQLVLIQVCVSASLKFLQVPPYALCTKGVGEVMLLTSKMTFSVWPGQLWGVEPRHPYVTTGKTHHYVATGKMHAFRTLICLLMLCSMNIVHYEAGVFKLTCSTGQSIDIQNWFKNNCWLGTDTTGNTEWGRLECVIIATSFVFPQCIHPTLYRSVYQYCFLEYTEETVEENTTQSVCVHDERHTTQSKAIVRNHYEEFHHLRTLIFCEIF